MTKLARILTWAKALCLTALLALLSYGQIAQARPMVLTGTEVDAPIEQVWEDWTTADGLESFFAPKAIVEARPGGAYEIWFLPDAPAGQRGAENGIVLGIQDKHMISFTWAMPPYMEEIRPHMTVVQIRFEPAGKDRTRIRLYHTGFGEGEAWDEGRNYFAKTWPQVLDNYRKHINDSAND